MGPWPERTKRAVVLWLVVYPTITALLYLLQPLIGDWPLISRTLVLTLIMVPLLQFVLLPRAQSLFAKWIEPPRQTLKGAGHD